MRLKGKVLFFSSYRHRRHAHYTRDGRTEERCVCASRGIMEVFSWVAIVLKPQGRFSYTYIYIYIIMSANIGIDTLQPNHLLRVCVFSLTYE